MESKQEEELHQKQFKDSNLTGDLHFKRKKISIKNREK